MYTDTLSNESILSSSKDVTFDQFPLRHWVEQALDNYFKHLDGQPAQALHDLVTKEVELGLLKTVMRYAQGNQSKAADWLGLARGTLRKKLALYNLD